MPKSIINLLTPSIARSSRPRLPSWSVTRSGAPGRSTPWFIQLRSQQLLGQRQQLRAVRVLVGVVLPNRLRDRAPFFECRLVEVDDLGALLRVDLRDRDVVGF